MFPRFHYSIWSMSGVTLSLCIHPSLFSNLCRVRILLRLRSISVSFFSPLSSGRYPIFKPGVDSLGSQTLHVEIRKVVLKRTERTEGAKVEILASYIIIARDMSKMKAGRR